MSNYSSNAEYYDRELNTDSQSEDYYGNNSNLNKSQFSSASVISSHIAASNTNSKAVLAALRALQDKIRRLESERSHALDESQALRHQLKNLEIEAEHAKQKDNLIAQRNMQEARSAYDRLQHEKTELEVKLSHLEENNILLQRQSDSLQNQIRTLEGEKHKNLLKIKELESQNLQIESQIGSAQEYEKDLANSLAIESKKHDDEKNSLALKMKELQKKLDKAYEEKTDHHQKVKELDKLISQLLSVNESLVEQLSGKITRRQTDQSISQFSTSVNKKPTQISKSPSVNSKKVVNPPRVASISTVASDASKSKKVPIQKLVHVKTDDIENLQKLHKMYSDIASTLLSDKRPHSKGKGSSQGQTLLDTSTKTENKILRSRTPTRLSKKKISLSNNQFDGSMVKVTRPHTSPAIIGERIQSNSRYLNDSIVSMGSSHAGESGVNLSTSSSMPYSQSKILSRPQDTADVVISLENEFDTLNQQYKNLLRSVQNDSMNETERAEELIAVIQKLHKKGEQLRSMKSPSK